MIIIFFIDIIAESKPFSSGFAMFTGKALLMPNSISSRDPATSAACLTDEKTLSLHAFYVSYYSKTDDYSSAYDDRAFFGAAYGANRFALKFAMEIFNFMNIYKEKDFFLSLGFRTPKKVTPAISMKLLKKELNFKNVEPHRSLNSSLAMYVNLKRASLLIDLQWQTDRLGVTNSKLNAPHINLALNTKSERHLNQGVRINIVPEDLTRSRLFWCTELKIGKYASTIFNIASNPIFLGGAISLQIKRSGLYFGSVVHPVLGASNAVGFEQLICRR